MNHPKAILNTESDLKSDMVAKPRIIFMGTPEFAVPSLMALAAAGFLPTTVVTGPDKARGRGQKMSSTAIKLAAVELGISDILQPEDVKSPDFAAQIADRNPDIMVVVAFRILPEAVFAAARIGTFNLHGSLLPAYRGAAPINRAVMAGDTQTGVTTFLLQQKVDTGNVLLRKTMPIGKNETAGEVHDRMMILGAEAVVETVRLLFSGVYKASPQDNSLASPAPKIFRNDCQIDWSKPASEVHNHIRGLAPYPGAFTFIDGKQLKILSSTLVTVADVSETERKQPGEVLASEGSLVLACGSGSIEVGLIQLEGKRALPTSEFLLGRPIAVGTTLGQA